MVVFIKVFANFNFLKGAFMSEEISEKQTSYSGSIEQELQSLHPLVSWRSTVAGLLVSSFALIGFLGLGMAFGGITMDEETTLRSIGLYTGTWFLISSCLSIFLGSYFAARVSRFKAPRVGAAQGIVIASLFMVFFLFEVILAVGGAGTLTGNLISKTSSMINSPIDRVIGIPAIREQVENVVGDLNLKSDPNLVTAGIAARLIRGNEDSAINYLANQAEISTLEASERISGLRNKINSITQSAKLGAAVALKSTGWSIFFMTLLSASFAVLGGFLGSVSNRRVPLARSQKLFFLKKANP
jgi:hypothetical protein